MQVNNISTKLKEIRLNKELTIDDVSSMLNVSKQGYSLWEQGKRNWNIDTLIKLSNILDFEMKIKNGELVILENSSNYTDEEHNKITKSKRPYNFKFKSDFNNEDINFNNHNYLIKKIKNKNILDKYPLCNYMFNEQVNLFLTNKIIFPNLDISESEIKEISKKDMNFFEVVEYIKNQTSTYLIIYDYLDGYRLSKINLFNFNDTNPNNYNGTYFSISVSLSRMYSEISDEYKNAIIVTCNEDSNYDILNVKYNYLHKFLILGSEFINKDIDTLDKETYTNTLKFKISFNEFKKHIENENTKYNDYSEFKSSVLMKIIKDALNFNLDIKFKEINESGDIMLYFEMLY